MRSWLIVATDDTHGEMLVTCSFYTHIQTQGVLTERVRARIDCGKEKSKTVGLKLFHFMSLLFSCCLYAIGLVCLCVFVVSPTGYRTIRTP